MVALASVSAPQFRLLDFEVLRQKPTLVPDLPPVESVAAEAIKQLRASLESAIAARLSSGAELVRALERKRRDDSLPTTITAIDALLDGGLMRGKVTEIAGRGLRFSIVMAALAAATAMGEAAALIDTGDHFDPQLGEAAGIDLRRLLWVRPKTIKQAATAAEILTVTGFQLVVFEAGLPPLKGRVKDAGWVRLARSAEAHGTALLVSSPYAITGTTSEAMLATTKPKPQWTDGLLEGFKATVRLEKHRHKKTGETACIEFKTMEAIATEPKRS